MDKLKIIFNGKGKVTKISAFVFVFGIMALFAGSVLSGPLDNVAGFAWGANTDGGLGWVSFNSTNDHDENTPGIQTSAINYGVTIDEATGFMTGYAWTPNFGWLRFGGLGNTCSDFPGAGANGTSCQNAQLVMSGADQGYLKGWARFCAPTGTPANCSGPTVPNLQNGGWDGWVSLRGTTTGGQQYGVIFNGDMQNGGIFSNYAWGGGDDSYGGVNTTGVGWLDFNSLFGNVTFNPINEPTVDLDAQNTILIPGQKAHLSWNGVDLVNSDTGCTATGGMTQGGGDGWNGSNLPSPSGTFTTGPLQAGTWVYTITCEGLNGNDVSDSITINVGVALQLSANPAHPLPDNDGNYFTMLSWTAEPTSGILPGSCVGTGGASDWNQSQSDPNSSLPGVEVPNPITHFVITCDTTSGGQVSAFVDVTQEEPVETMIFNNGPVQNGLVTLTWSTTYLQNCVASSENPTSGVNWQGGKPDDGSQSGVIVPNQEGNDTHYILSCESTIPGNPGISKFIPLNTGSGANQGALPFYVEG